MDALSPASELRELLAAGDLRAAGEWLVARHAADVVSFCRSMVRERSVAEDLAQDVFSNAFSNLRSYRAEAAPRTWLLAIARNRCIDHLRRAQREPWLPAGDDANEPDHYADDAPLPAELLLRRADVETALSELVEGERALVVLRFRHGLEYPELATVFGLREGTVRMRLSRALSKMRERLHELESQLTLAEADVAGERAAAPAPRRSAEAAGSAPRPLPGGGRPAARGAPPAQPAAPARGVPPAPAAARSPVPPPRSAAPSGGPPPPPAPAARPAAPPSPASPPERPAAKGRGLVGRARDWLLGAPAALPSSPFAAALTPEEPEVSQTLRDRLARLVATLG